MRTPVSVKATIERQRLGQAFGEWLIAWDYTPVSFAARCRINPKRVRDWLNGTRRPPILLPIVQELLEQEKGTQHE